MSNIKFSKTKDGHYHLYEKKHDSWNLTESRKSLCGEARLNMMEELTPTTPYPDGACEDCIDILKPDRVPKGPKKIARMKAEED